MCIFKYNITKKRESKVRVHFFRFRKKKHDFFDLFLTVYKSI